MKMENSSQNTNIINDWADFFCVIGIDFMLIVLGVWTLPQLPKKTHLLFSLSILLSAIFFTKKFIEFIKEKWKQKKK